MALLPPETLEFVLTNELKRAVRSQNYVTLVTIQPAAGAGPEAADILAALIAPELRETDLVANEGPGISVVLLDADLPSSTRVIDRVTSRLEHYQFTTPLAVEVGVACCPTHGTDAESLRRVAAETRTTLSRHEPRGGAHAS
jgi:hypothetical protein